MRILRKISQQPWLPAIAGTGRRHRARFMVRLREHSKHPVSTGTGYQGTSFGGGWRAACLPAAFPTAPGTASARPDFIGLQTRADGVHAASEPGCRELRTVCC